MARYERYDADEMKRLKIVLPDGGEIKVMEFDSVGDLDKAQAWLAGIVCGQFYVVMEKIAEQEGKTVSQLLESKEKMNGYMSSFLSDFTGKLLRTARNSVDENWDKVFKPEPLSEHPQHQA